MDSDLLIPATGLVALVLNVLALARSCERALRVQSSIAGLAWALNNLLLGAHTAAALSLVSAGRTASSAATLRAGERLRRRVFLGFAALTVLVAACTWQGWVSLFLSVASVLSTYAMFYMQGRPLRWMMVAVSILWMVNAWSYGSWEQAAANAATAAAALYAGWRGECEGRDGPSTISRC
ncbi:MAG TPA: YgjV family protein [Burkholderiaceae bacterium]|nr:YgjV family protein [Burkholderiaceae bacterium]